MLPLHATPVVDLSDEDLAWELALRRTEPQCLGVRRRLAELEQESIRRSWEASA